ncbi:phosphoribosyltransferase [Streptomyces sp. NPDC090052]|uniref:phosphoribosyltransferase n=1 Tax=unclassified Streptomyces TaxID=2593676 RepID=UPI002254F9FE|nr:phosphoribosyltransferase family protein [Streptomyces sp. NBC_01306]MCX4728168.1 phosphoribosyltransferase family protein [Streptomyces sp. NBC_01306]WSV02607.1 phosphoribosyltransferase family protein [Streptomyces sp. NBC_01020]WSX40676.1 phosphoribosyltransferase family protein [Streptomyces sp. NBC_00963]
MRFRDRREAGRDLAAALLASVAADGLVRPLVLGLPRGGVPVAAEVARALEAPLDVLVVRKIGAPGQPETGVGAIAGDDPPLFDSRSLRWLGLSEDALASTVARERTELHRREDLYRHGRPPLVCEGRTVILVDDGLATGVTARAAVRHLRRQAPGRLLLAVPVGAADGTAALRQEADDVICLQQPALFQAVGQWYEQFDQTSDGEVIEILREFTVPT